MCGKLSKWTWVLPQLSYRKRVLIAYNLIRMTEEAGGLFLHMGTLDQSSSTVFIDSGRRTWPD